MHNSGQGGRAAPFIQEQRGNGLPPTPEGDYIFPRWMRRLCLCAGILVAYSQFATLSFASFFRYVRPYREQLDGYIGDRYPAWGLQSAETYVGRIQDLPPTSMIFMLEAAIVALLGSAGLFCIAYARKAWRAPRWRLLAASIVGGTMPVVMLLFEQLRSFQRWEHFRYDEIYLSESYPLHGAFEFVSGVALPFFLYLA